jgi:hypothetical protein
MPRVGLEPTTPVFKQAKTVRALDCAATVIGNCVKSYIFLQRLKLPMFYMGHYSVSHILIVKKGSRRLATSLVVLRGFSPARKSN